MVPRFRLWYSTNGLQVNLQALLEVDKKDYSNLFSTIEHEITCGEVPAASVRLHFIRHNAGGLIPMGNVVDTLISYITHFCFTSERRADLGEQARNRTFVEARRLFRTIPTTGQPGELLVYFLIEAVLQAPQVLKKMPLTTNANDERKGSDGVHICCDVWTVPLLVITAGFGLAAAAFLVARYRAAGMKWLSCNSVVFRQSLHCPCGIDPSRLKHNRKLLG